MGTCVGFDEQVRPRTGTSRGHCGLPAHRYWHKYWQILTQISTQILIQIFTKILTNIYKNIDKYWHKYWHKYWRACEAKKRDKKRALWVAYKQLRLQLCVEVAWTQQVEVGHNRSWKDPEILDFFSQFRYFHHYMVQALSPSNSTSVKW